MNLPAPTDWSREIDSSFGHGSDRPAEAYAALGRRVQRRRRALQGSVAGLTVATMALAGPWALNWWGDGPGGNVGPVPAATPDQPVEPQDPGPTVAPMARTADDVAVATREWEGSDVIPVTATEDGGLEVLDGWRVTRLVVVRESDTERRWGLVLSSPDGSPLWALVDWEGGDDAAGLPGHSGATTDRPGARFTRFADWLSTTLALQDASGSSDQPPAGEQDAVAIVTSGEVVALNGAEVLAQRPAPDGWSAYGPANEQFAVKLRTADGRTWFARVDPEGSTTVDPAVLDVPTMRAFMEHVTSRAESGEGLR
ncbi:hypothetical protein IEQ44_14730 [Nocardioides sp. Y6]|uniref:Uncharacterized protein n=1 Tax=Nocardioides malaquae TaxID=2773426 RepID=A0ABR9RWE0_9ACTN|nr:hypothetical protein [Nocardioides malaquae]MBE7325903.1 hypothetical protein [Nocardioides malaquae]